MGRSDNRAELSDWLANRYGVHRLMNLLERFIGRHCTSECHNWISFRIGGCQPGHKIGNTWPGSGNGHAGLSRHASNASSNKSGILLVPAYDGFDLRIDQGVEDGIDLSSRNTENIFDSVGFKSLNDYFGSVLGLFFRLNRHCLFP